MSKLSSLSYEVQYKIFHPGCVQASISSPLMEKLDEKLHFKGASDGPLISSLMVTKGDPSKVKRSIAMFNNQTWKNKQLIIVSDVLEGSLRDFVESSNCNIKLLEIPGKESLGTLRNISVEAADGEIICQWDDDDFYSSDRLSISASILTSLPVSAVFLREWFVWWKDRSLLFLSSKRIWEGSMMAWKSCLPNYPSLSRREDTIMVDELTKSAKIGVFSYPRMYCYSVHGDNTWDTDHFELMLKHSQKIYSRGFYHRILRSLNLHLE